MFTPIRRSGTPCSGGPSGHASRGWSAWPDRARRSSRGLGGSTGWRRRAMRRRGVVTMRVGGLALAAMAAAALASGALAAQGASRAKRSTRIVAASRRTFGEGAWSWFADPRAVYSRGRVVAGWVDRDKYVEIA